MAEDEKKEEGTEKEKKGKGSGGLIKILIIAIGFVVVVVIVMIVAKNVAENAVKVPEDVIEAEPRVEKRLPPESLHVNIMGDYVARLNDVGEERYVKLKELCLAFNADKYEFLAAELADRKYQITDIINEILLGQTSEVSSREGKKALKKEFLKQINVILREGQVDDIYFEIIVQ